MSQSHYSLRWNNHQSHILAQFDALLQAENLVDVTLVCAETSIRAHKVVLSACSPFFERIFSENPCKHPVIVLKDFCGWEVQAIVDFMYKGEVSVLQEQLQSLIKAAESLQVRGLSNQEQFGMDKDTTASLTNHIPTPSTSPNDYERNYFGSGRLPTPFSRSSPYSPLSCPTFDAPIKLPHMPRLSFPESLLPSRLDCQSPVPRRKQARPRRRSGEMCAQDLSATSNIKPSMSPSIEETAENLCIKRRRYDRPTNMARGHTTSNNNNNNNSNNSDEDNTNSRIVSTTRRSPDPAVSPEIDLSMQNSSNREYRNSPPVSLPPTLNMNQESQSPVNRSPINFPPMPSISALAMTPPHNTYFGLDTIPTPTALGLFPHNINHGRNPFDIVSDPRTAPETTHLYVKKKMGRPKGQHSAPRGGPPRSWTNAELTEALQQVWNKKMTTSQASRVFGIPYNSLLMYVRGKYGKSLKLEQLRKDCIGGPPIDLINLATSNNNNNNNNTNNNNNNISIKNERGDNNSAEIQSNTRPSSTEEPSQHTTPSLLPPLTSQPTTPTALQAVHSLYQPYAHHFYPDFASFPIPVNMVHLLPQSENNHGQQPTNNADDLNGHNRNEPSEDENDVYNSPALSVSERRELVQQNGQD